MTFDGMHFDVAIIGAGINGASSAQHLSAAGYRVLVVDQGDFADGATSRSSRLLHCGLRHLASGASFRSSLRPDRLIHALNTARHDMLARDEIVSSIPERLRPIDFYLPIYADDVYAPWQLDAAFALLRTLSPRGVSLDYRRHDRKHLHCVPLVPWLRNPEKLRSVVVFREYLFDWPERIALDALFDARRMGAEVHNYTRVEELGRAETGGRWRLSLVSVERGGAAGQVSANDTARVTASLVVNLAGAWVDRVIARTGATLEPRCAGIKGVHIALRLPREFSDRGIFSYNRIGEPLYCLPSNGLHYVGLTRRPSAEDPGGVAATDEEIDWMISEFNYCLPQLAITRTDILYSWAGINPLTRDRGEPLGSRRIRIHDMADDGLPGMLTLTGGPIMTHRRIARRILAAVTKRLTPSGVAREMSNRWIDHEAENTAPRIERESFSVSSAAVRRSARYEQPGNLADLLMRRLGAGWAGDQGLALARPVAELAAAELGWSEARVDAELRAYERHLATTRRRPGN